jgi:membrane protease YdiL (CAAX protease family)
VSVVARRPNAARVLVPVMVAFGGALLVLRPGLAGVGEPGRSLLLGAVLLTILVASLAVPGARRRGGLSAAVAVSGAGIVALGLAWVVSEPRPPVPWAATAVPLSLLAAVAEEALFRRVLYERLEPFGVMVAVVGAAVAFALLHVPLYGWAVFPVDLGAGILFGWQRHAAGTWTVPAGTHAVANLLAVLR